MPDKAELLTLDIPPQLTPLLLLPRRILVILLPATEKPAFFPAEVNFLKPLT